jgi:predicted pyridoxine 5'-phosphate oxidase superfamily flavin-nucleotide-binding protein
MADLLRAHHPGGRRPVPRPVSDVAFTPAVKAQQTRLGSRAGYVRLEQKGGWQDRVTPDLAAFLAARESCYLATASAEGQPYVQHRGGPKGFLKVLDDKHLAFADFRGNRQYITLGNLSENDRAFIFLMDYATRQRIKIWGRARAVEDDPELLARLADPAYKGRPERAIVFEIAAWDVNCPQHIPRLYSEDQVAAAIGKLQARIAELESDLARLRDGAQP